MNYLSLFSGIGAFEKALENIGIDYDLVNYCEIDKYASKSYSAIHGWNESYNLGDITKIDEKSLPKGIDLVTYGFPCQDISLAGKQKGFFHEDGTQTRSGLFFDALRIIEETQPKIAIAENVKNLTSKKFKEQFKIVLSSLEEAGYNNYWQILNAKDYGIPQNRERVFIVSIRKDIDTGIFEFPEGFPLKKRLKDVLESDVDEKYYLSEKIQERFTLTDETFSKNIIGTTIGDDCKRHGERDVVYQLNGIIGTLNATDYKQPKQILVREATSKGYAEAYEGDSINLGQPNSKTRRGRVGRQVAQTLTTSPQQVVVEPFIVASRGRNPENPSDRSVGSPTEQRLEINKNGTSNTITTVQKDNYVLEPQVLTPKRTEYGKSIRKAYESGLINESRHNMTEMQPREDGICNTLTTVQKDNYLATTDFRIRKLTPLECWRLMGFDDEDFYKAEKVNSNTQLYKQAGNSIVVDVAEELLRMLFDEKGNLYI